jgi:hypothetical protein
VGQIDHQGGGVEGDEHVRLVPRRRDALAAELNLECRDAVAGARRRADLGGKSGRVARSLPPRADATVNCCPWSWMPSPESPAKRTT